MAIYQISYELRTKDFDYSNLFDFLETNQKESETIQVLDNVWWIYYRESGMELNKDNLLKKLTGFMGREDILFINDVPTSNYAGRLPKRNWDWLLKHNQKYN